MTRGLGAMFAALVVTSGTAALAAPCPSYTPAVTANRCGYEPVPGTNPTPDQWLSWFERVAAGSSTWSPAGPQVDPLATHCDRPLPRGMASATWPCHVLYGVAFIESGWQQFCAPTSPPSEVGKASRTIVSRDCGYGVMQVTSGMRTGESPEFDAPRVAADALYDLRVGAAILAEKWNRVACVGDRDPAIVEDWYSALWAYNGLSYVNNPNNPTLEPARGVYDPRNGGAYTYQERVFGVLETARGVPFATTELAYPDRADVGSRSSPPALGEPSCASPTDCGARRPVHRSSCRAPRGGGDPDAGNVVEVLGSGGMEAEPGAGTTGFMQDAGDGPIVGATATDEPRDEGSTAGCVFRPRRDGRDEGALPFVLVLALTLRGGFSPSPRLRRSGRR